MLAALSVLRRASFALVTLGATLAACGSSSRTSGDKNGAAGDPTAIGQDASFSERDASANPPPRAIGHLKGKVVAPEGTVPVSNALVYLTTHLPEVIPAHAYCDTCVHLTPLEPYAYSAPDGTFDLPAYATGKQYLVVQKGQFRRVREVDVREGDQPVAGPYTRLPGKNDLANNDTIPQIAMAAGGFDKIDYSLKKLGIEEFYRYADGPFDIGGPPPGIKTGKTGRDLTNEPVEMGKYHIVLLPCAAFGYTRDEQENRNLCGSPMASEQQAFKTYVEGGGKLYVTDYGYEAIRQTWPGFVTFYDDRMGVLAQKNQGIGTGCRGGAENTPGTANDKGLGDWMTAIGHPNVTLEQSWTRIESVAPQPGVDADGQPKTITPKVWMSSEFAGAQHPATVSFEQRCGRVLFSTYHTEGSAESALLAQEKALLYILLEVGVCVGELPPPPIR